VTTESSNGITVVYRDDTGTQLASTSTTSASPDCSFLCAGPHVHGRRSTARETSPDAPLGARRSDLFTW
jgi:hypothetical protein